MKIRVSYFDQQPDCDRSVEFTGTKEFPINFDSDDAMIIIDEIIDEFEDQGICTIDCGGDDDFYELDIADCDPTTDRNELCRLILEKIETKLGEIFHV